MVIDSSEPSSTGESVPDSSYPAADLAHEKLAQKLAEFDAIQTKFASLVAAAEQARDDTQKAYQAALVIQTQMQSDHESIAKLKSDAEQDRKQIADSATSIAGSKATAESEVAAIKVANEAVSTAKSSGEGILRQLAEMSSTAQTVRQVVEAERDKAVQGNSMIEAAKIAVDSASTAVAEAKSAAERDRSGTAQILVEVQTTRDAAKTAVTEINEARINSENAAKESTNELSKAQKAAADAVVAKDATVDSAQEVDKLKQQISEIQQHASKAAKGASEASQLAEAEAKRAQEAHNLSTTAGLAGAFNEKALNSTLRGRLWSIVLMVSLVAVGCIGWSRYGTLTEFIAAKPEPWPLTAEVVLSLLGVGAPIWLAWVATRMVSKSFALTEDYAYKAALAKAYVGFREQAKQLGDPIFEQRLFAAAVTQLDANPVRLLDASHPGSPLQDLLQQPFIQQALEDASFKRALIEWLNSRFRAKLPIPPSQTNFSPSQAAIPVPLGTPISAVSPEIGPKVQQIPISE